jgi:hypothetical protein
MTQPVYLLILTRVPGLKGRNASQFALSNLATLGLWIGSLIVFNGPVTAMDIVIGTMILVSAGLAYLEAWALLSRGYTLGLLLTLLQAEKPLTDTELSCRYRSGDGLAWIMHHRVGGLVDAGLVRREGERLTLAPIRGALIASMYKLCITVLGLRRTG